MPPAVDPRFAFKYASNGNIAQQRASLADDIGGGPLKAPAANILVVALARHLPKADASGAVLVNTHLIDYLFMDDLIFGSS